MPWYFALVLAAYTAHLLWQAKQLTVTSHKRGTVMRALPVFIVGLVAKGTLVITAMAYWVPSLCNRWVLGLWFPLAVFSCWEAELMFSILSDEIKGKTPGAKAAAYLAQAI